MMRPEAPAPAGERGWGTQLALLPQLLFQYIARAMEPPRNLTYGLIGHRDIAASDIPRIRAALTDWWKSEVVLAPQQVTLLTSLAAGAAQLATDILIKNANAREPRLHVVLPDARDAYAKEVEKDEEKQAAQGGVAAGGFHRLTTRQDVQFTLREPAPAVSASDEQRKKEGVRRAGRHIAENADVLLALWDGVHGGKGDTSNTIAYAISEECREIRKAKRRMPLRVVWLAVPRRSNPHPAGEAFTVQEIPTNETPRFSGFAGTGGWGRRLRRTALLALAVSSVSVSLWGYHLDLARCDAPAAAILDRSILAVSHLVMESLAESTGLGGHGAPWVRAGRWLGVAFFIVAGASIVDRIFGTWVALRTWWVTRRVRHDLVCGLGWRGRALVQSGRDKGATVVVELNPDPSARELCRRAGAALIEGDAADPAILGKAGVKNLRHAFICSPDDETNLRITHELAKLRATSTTRSWRPSKWLRGESAQLAQPLVCCVSLTHSGSAGVLNDVLPENHGLDLRVFNAEAVTARMVLKTYPLDRFTASPDCDGARAVLIGESPMAWELFEQFLQQGHFEKGRPLGITWLSADPAALCEQLVTRHPIFAVQKANGGPLVAAPEFVWLEQQVLPLVTFVRQPRSKRSMLELFEGNLVLREQQEVTSVFVALDSTPESLGIAALLAPVLEMQRSARRRDITMVVYYQTPEKLYRDDIEQALNRDYPRLPIMVFSDFLGDCSKETVRADEIDRVARRVNGVYARGVAAAAAADFDNVCEQEWTGLSEADKESSREAAAHAHVKARIRSRLLAKGCDDKGITEALARIEHNRWCANRLLAGFRPLTGVPPSAAEKEEIAAWFTDKSFKNACRRARKHVDLVPFDDFDRIFDAERAPKERQKDYDQIKALDHLLRRA